MVRRASGGYTSEAVAAGDGRCPARTGDLLLVRGERLLLPAAHYAEAATTSLGPGSGACCGLLPFAASMRASMGVLLFPGGPDLTATEPPPRAGFMRDSSGWIRTIDLTIMSRAL